MRNYSCKFHLSRGLSLAQQSLELSGLFNLDIPKLFQNVKRFSIESDLLFVLLVDEGKGFQQVTVMTSLRSVESLEFLSARSRKNSRF